MAWEPGQKHQFAISKPSSTGAYIAGNFISFVPQQEEDGGIVLEDGFAVLLRDESWQRIRAALEGGQPLSLPAESEDRMGLEIVWLPELDPDCGDPLESHVPSGWAAFGGNLKTHEPVYMKSISLLTINDVLRRRVETEALATYINAIKATVKSHLTDATDSPGQDLALECEVRQDGGRTFGFLVRPETADDAIEGMRGHLMEIAPPKVVAPIRFQLNIQLRGGSGMRKPKELN
jgi:hypothetical protein